MLNNSLTAKSKTKLLGEEGEALVAQYLLQQGFKIEKTNYSCLRGEIDIIAYNNEFVIFVEVKTRRKAHFATSAVITKSKQNKIVLAAKHFLQKNPGQLEKACRFDVAILVATDQFQQESNNWKLNYIPNAFFGK